MLKRLFIRDVLSGSLLIVLSLLLWVRTLSFPELENGYPGPALFPQLIAFCLGILGAYLVVRSVASKNTLSPSSRPSSKGRVLRLFTGIILVATYPLFVHHIHFIPIMAGLIFFFGIILNNKPWKAMLTAVLSAGLIYALFTQLLGVPL
ncbi:MAG: tripartite tricarboxylate transporter TctB family protein [Rhodothermaceae bacterium]|nr:tripartite tricarboxylate transporter TctB family protein [Rhodothermaceae bacterium]